MRFRRRIVILLMFSFTAQATTKDKDCWEMLLEATARANTAAHEFVRLVKVAEDLFGVPAFSHKNSKSTRALSSTDKEILLEWIEGIENFGLSGRYSYQELASATSKLPKTQGIFFAKSSAFLKNIILEKDLEEGDIVIVPPESGFSASKMTPEWPIPSFATHDGHALSIDPKLFFSEGPYLFVFGEARDFEAVYPFRSDHDYQGSRLQENEVNFGAGTKFKVLKVIYHSDDSAGTFFLKQI